MATECSTDLPQAAGTGEGEPPAARPARTVSGAWDDRDWPAYGEQLKLPYGVGWPTELEDAAAPDGDGKVDGLGAA